MKFTPEQEKAIRICVQRINAGEPVTRFFGFAGTGKTTTAKAIAEEVGGIVVFGAYTGKAASVLVKKGCPARTVHSLFYWHEKDVTVKGKIVPVFGFDPKKLRDALGRPRLIVLDEVSMIDQDMAEDIMSLGVPVLAVGDPAQLPPVTDKSGRRSSSAGYFTNGEPDAMLSEVVRHEGRVLELATAIREWGARAVKRRQFRDMVVDEIGQSEALDYDQVLTGTNKTRWQKNETLRRLNGIEDGELIRAGDRIMCKANNPALGVFNGQQFRVLATEDDDVWMEMKNVSSILELFLGCECLSDDDAPELVCPVCGWISRWVQVWAAGFYGEKGEQHLSGMDKFKRYRAMEAIFGYAITVHKAQGSEWDNVLVINEARSFKGNQQSWLYTAVTRASENVTIINPVN